MAFIYRYELKDPNSRKVVNLTNHRENIEETIKKVFVHSFKEILVDEEYFEFKLHSKASDTELRKMGRVLVKKDKELNNIKKIKYNGSELFIRTNSEYYGYLENYRKKEYNIILNFDLVEKFNIIDYYENSKESYISKRETLRNIDTYRISMYIDIRTISKKNKNLIDGIKEGSWYLIKGRLSNAELESEIFLDFTAFHRSEIKEETTLISGFRTILVEKIDDNIKGNLNSFFSTEGISYKELPSHIPGIDVPEIEKYKIIVYNVGQGLCSAICDESEHPYIYFDFGRGYWRDRCTYPGGMCFDSTHKPKIILSHWDADHYILVNDCKEALDCEWITSKNVKGPNATKLSAELSARGNLVRLSSDMNLVWGRIIVGNGSDNHKHNDGLSLLLELDSKDINNNIIPKRYLLTGDNKYGVLPNYALQNLDVLLASHHGGTYDNVCDASNIPNNTNNGLVIYSYGKHDKFLPFNNSHKHPSYVQQYRDAGWLNEVHIADGQYTLE